MINKKPYGYWTKERCKQVALNCQTRRDFYEKFSGAYDAAHRNLWLNEIYLVVDL